MGTLNSSPLNEIPINGGAGEEAPADNLPLLQAIGEA